MNRFDRLRDETAATFRLAVPVAAVQLVMMLMGVVDTMMLGHLSAEALVAGALAHLVTFCVLVLGQGILAALDPPVSQAHGARDPPVSGHDPPGGRRGTAVTRRLRARPGCRTEGANSPGHRGRGGNPRRRHA
jgi:hypothetical protein